MDLFASRLRGAVLRWPLVAGALFATGTAACGPLGECRFDSDCGFGSVCDTTAVPRCVAARSCDVTQDCEPEEVCEQRPQEPPTHPFENGTPGRKVCVCASFDCSEGGFGGSF